MVAATPLPPELPQLSERESELLAHFLILRYDMVELAERNKLLPQQLLAFAHSPAVNAHLAAFKSFAETSFTLRLLEARTKALDILEKVATTSDNPIEQRRAASTIFRGVGLQRARESRSEPRDRAGARLPERATPRAIPSPALTPEDVIDEVTVALADHHDPDAAATLEAFLADHATINGEPATPASLEDSLDDLIPEAEVVQTQVSGKLDHTPGPPETRTSHIYLIHDRGPQTQTRIKIILTRQLTGAHPGCWLISSLHIGPNTS